VSKSCAFSGTNPSLSISGGIQSLARWRVNIQSLFFDGLLCPVYGALAGAIRSPVGFGAWPGL